LKIVKTTDLDLSQDITALRKRISELESRNTAAIADTYLSALKTYSDNIITSQNAIKESE